MIEQPQPDQDTQDQAPVEQNDFPDHDLTDAGLSKDQKDELAQRYIEEIGQAKNFEQLNAVLNRAYDDLDRGRIETPQINRILTEEAFAGHKMQNKHAEQLIQQIQQCNSENLQLLLAQAFVDRNNLKIRLDQLNQIVQEGNIREIRFMQQKAQELLDAAEQAGNESEREAAVTEASKAYRQNNISYEQLQEIILLAQINMGRVASSS